MKQLGLGMIMYVDDYSDALPPRCTNNPNYVKTEWQATAGAGIGIPLSLNYFGGKKNDMVVPNRTECPNTIVCPAWRGSLSTESDSYLKSDYTYARDQYDETGWISAGMLPAWGECANKVLLYCRSSGDMPFYEPTKVNYHSGSNPFLFCDGSVRRYTQNSILKNQAPWWWGWNMADFFAYVEGL